MIASIGEVVVRVQGLADGYVAAVAVVADDLAQNTQTPQQVANLRASMAGLLGSFRALRKDLDATATAILVQTQNNAARLLQVWTWERETRKAVQDFATGMVETDRTAQGLNEGSDRATITVREGDTLQAIAARELGDFQAWPKILEMNPGLVPGELQSGTTLILPEKR